MLLKDIQSNTNSVRNANGIMAMASTQKSLLCKLLKTVKVYKDYHHIPSGILNVRWASKTYQQVFSKYHKIPVGMLRMLAYSKETFRYK